jgi:glycosyltransferase involved in cell wall biosynthesis
MLVGQKAVDDGTVHSVVKKKTDRMKGFLRSYLNSLPPRLYRRRSDATFSASCMGLARLYQHPMVRSADVVCLHWVAGGFLRPRDLVRIGKPVVWRLSDMWPFTGGCHYSGGCERYEDSCGKCPQLGSASVADLSRWNWRRKRAAWECMDLTVVAPSRWIADCAQRSSLFRGRRIERIATGVDLARYRPLDRDLARKSFGFPPDKKLILFGALAATSDRRKGFDHLQAAVRRFGGSIRTADYHLVVFGGASDPPDGDIGIPATYVGRLHDDISLALLYSAGDVLVLPAIEDNLPNVAIEAIACGTPVVAFKIGGMPDIVEHRRNGYLAPPFDTDDLARGIEWVLVDDDRHDALCAAARRKAEERFDLTDQARRYRALFLELAGPCETYSPP